MHKQFPAVDLLGITLAWISDLELGEVIRGMP